MKLISQLSLIGACTSQPDDYLGGFQITVSHYSAGEPGLSSLAPLPRVLDSRRVVQERISRQARICQTFDPPVRHISSAGSPLLWPIRWVMDRRLSNL